MTSNAVFSFDIDHGHQLVFATMSGFYAPADVATFAAAMDRAHDAMGTPAGEHVVLVDIRAMDIQPQDSVSAFQAMLARPDHRARKVAFVTATSLARTQARRAATGREAAYFSTIDEARDWLTKA